LNAVIVKLYDRARENARRVDREPFSLAFVTILPRDL
jgi:hypothetical protein